MKKQKEKLKLMRERKSLQDIKDICAYHRVNKRLPSYSSKDPVVWRLAVKLINLRAARKGKGTSVFLASYQELASKLGQHDLFLPTRDAPSRAAIQLRSLNAVLRWMRSHKGKRPSSNTSERSERLLGVFVAHLRNGSRGKGNTRLYPSTAAAIKASRYPWLLDTTKKTPITGGY